MKTNGATKPQLLIVEDDENLSVVLSILLSEEGWATRCEKSGEAALEILEQESFDLLLLDVMLPGMNGFQVARTIRRKEKPGEHLPIILITIKSGLKDRVTGLEAGADDYIVKPFKNQELLARIRAHLRTKQVKDHLLVETQHWLAVFESIDDGALIIDEGGFILKANAGFCDLFGYSRSELQDKLLSSLGLVSPDVESRWLAQLKQHQPFPAAAISQDIQVTAPSGQTMWAQVCFRPLPNGDPDSNTPAMGLCIWRDITAQQEMEEALRRQNRYLAMLNTVTAARNSLDLDEILENTHKKLLDVLGLDIGEIYLLDESGQLLTLATQQGLSDEFVQQATTIALGESLTGLVAQTGEPIILTSGAAKDSRVSLAVSQSSGVEAIAILPICARGRILGTLAVGSFQVYQFSDIERDLLLAVADQLGIAIENAQLYQRTDAHLYQRIAELTAINQMGRAVSSILDLDHLLQVIMQNIKDISQVEAGSLILVDEATEELVFKVVLQEKEAERLLGLRLPPGTGVVGHCIEHNEPILVADVTADSRFYPNIDKLSGLNTQSLLCVPLETKNKVLGAIELLNKDKGSFTAQDMEFLASMAAFVAIAIDNAQLYAALRDHAFLLEQKVTSRTSELKAILNSVADGLVVTNANDQVVMVNPAARQWLNIREGSDLQHEGKIGLQWRAIQGLARISEGEQTAEIEIPVAREQDGEACYDWFNCTADCPARQSIQDGKVCWLMPDTMCFQSHMQGFEDDLGEYCLSCKFYRHQDKITLQAHSAQITDQAGEFVGEVTVLRDITRLKEVDRLKSQFVSNVSHELKTPLGNLKLYIPLLERGKPEKRERYLNVLNQEVDRLEGLITDLLDLSRLDTGKFEADKQPLAINQVIERALSTLSLGAEDKEVSLNYTPDTDLAQALANEGQIHQVVTNLVANGINYTPPGGKIDITTGMWQQKGQDWHSSNHLPTPEQLTLDPPAGLWIVLRIADTGQGIPKDDLPHLFERFFRGQAAHSDVPGTGLGLSIVKEIVNLHQGHIFVESQLEKGSTFTILLPAYQELERPLVLIAEDEEDIHLALEGFLGWAGFDVEHAFDGEQALEHIAFRQPDLLLLDLKMPKLDGYQVIKALRTNEATIDLPILVLTSWTQDRAQKALQLGANEFLTKPFSGDVLIDVIRRMLKLS